MKELIFIVFLIQCSLIFCQEVLVVDSSIQQIKLNEYAYYFIDSTVNLSVSEIEKERWKKVESKPTFRSSKYVVWMRYNFINQYNKSIDRVIYIPYHHIHEIDIFLVSDSLITTLFKTGTKRPFENKHYKSKGYPVKIELEAKKYTSVLIRFNHLYRPLRASTYLTTQERINKIVRSNNNLAWFWRGVFLFAFFVSLLLFFVFRLKVFLYYFLLHIGVGLFIASQIGDYFLFNNIDRTDNISLIAFTGVVIINFCFPLFLAELTPIKLQNRTIWKWVYFFVLTMAPVYLLNLIPSIRMSVIMYYSHLYFMFISGLVFILMLFMLFKRLIRNDKPSIILFIIYSIYVLIVFFDTIIPNLGLIADYPNSHRSILIASIAEIIILLVLLAKESLNIYRERAELLVKQQSHQKEVIVSILSAQEEERNRVGRELHDSIGANMSIIKQQIGNSNIELFKIVNQTIEIVRNLSHSLVSPKIEKDEFIDEIKELCDLFSTSSLVIQNIFHNWPNIDKTETATHLYRIVQELLQNAVKHSKARNVYLQFIGENDHEIMIVYEDNGRGFKNENGQNKGQGIRNIESRVNILEGSLEIDSSKNDKGCTIIMVLKL